MGTNWTEINRNSDGRVNIWLRGAGDSKGIVSDYLWFWSENCSFSRVSEVRIDI